MKSLEVTLRDLRATGRKALVPYFMAGATPDWVLHVEAAVLGGADAIEIGIPFSDPMMDGVVIQEAAERSLAAGTTLSGTVVDAAGKAVSNRLAIQINRESGDLVFQADAPGEQRAQRRLLPGAGDEAHRPPRHQRRPGEAGGR